MKFATLEGRRVAVWGHGREGRAALAALRRHLPGQSLTLFCNDTEAADAALGEGVEVRTHAPDGDALAAFEFVIKSPGISIYKPEIVAAQARGTVFTSGTALWFGEHPEARVVGITGTKGKSTTSALIAHLARALGVRTALAGNIGLPLLELDGPQAALWVVELSSFQTGEAGPLELGIVVSLGEDHLDWHGTRERYVADKLKLAAASRTLLVNATQAFLLERTANHPARRFFGRPDGWHIDDGLDARRSATRHNPATRHSGPSTSSGQAALRASRNPLSSSAMAKMDSGLRRDDGNEVSSEATIAHANTRVMPLSALPLHGRHNALNACAALAAIELLGLDAEQAAPSLRDFKPLPHRLTSLGTRDGIEWIDDSISTTPDAALAALESLGGRAVTLILGGHDRGLAWENFAQTVRAHPPHAVITHGAAGPRIARTLRDARITCVLAEAADLATAVAQARACTPSGGVIVLSPGAPSFDAFRNYAERGRAFAQLAGINSDAIGGITGLGIA